VAGLQAPLNQNSRGDRTAIEPFLTGHRPFFVLDLGLLRKLGRYGVSYSCVRGAGGPQPGPPASEAAIRKPDLRNKLKQRGLAESRWEIRFEAFTTKTIASGMWPC
jgi:hypothetical protein